MMKSSNLSIESISIEHLVKPIGIDCKNPRFAWILQNQKDYNVEQKSYEIKLLEGDEIVACSGKCESSESTEIEIKGFQTKPKTRYRVIVDVYDSVNNNAHGETWFETGFLDENWSVSWMEPDQIPTEPSKDFSNVNLEQDDLEIKLVDNKDKDYSVFRPAQYIRIPVSVMKNLTKARAYVSSHGVYHFLVNGKRTDDFEFAPDNTSYDDFLQYQTYDLTPLLNKGENIAGIVLGDGWWCGRIGATGDSCQYGTTLGILIQIELEYDDGTKEILGGEKGVSSTGPIIYSDIFVGEKYDAGKELPGWAEVNFDDSDWKPLKKKDYSMSNLCGQYGNPVKPVKILKPAAILVTPAGETVVDVGQVVAGQSEFTVESPKGVEIKLEHSEVLDKEGNFFNNVLGVNKEQTDIYITKEGIQKYRPSFTYHGFRYIKVSGWPGELKTDNFTIYVLSSEMEITGSFSTSDERINRLQDNIVWSQIANTISIPTDCPQRERAGWTGDIMAFAPTMCFNRDADAFLTRWMKSLRSDQLENGAVPDVVPYIKSYRAVNKMQGVDTSCGWGDAVLRVPLAVYHAYGDRRILEENYEAMKKWMNYIDARVKNHHPDGYEMWDEERKQRSRYLWNTDFHFGDWLVPSMVLGNPDGGAMINTAFATMGVVAPAYYAFSALSMKEVADALGKKDDSAYYGALYEKIRQAFIDEYEDENGIIKDLDIQGIYVIALKNGLVTEDVKPKMLKHLCNLIEENNNCLDTGFLSVFFLMDVLFENGYKDLAYKLLFQTRCPSWLYEVEHGATTMWESWGAVLEDGTVSTYSYNHYAFGCIGEWMYKELGGIHILEPGYRRVRIQPAFDCGLNSVNAEKKTPYGNLQVNWEKDGECIKLSVTVPVNVRAEIYLGKNDSITVGSGSYNYKIECSSSEEE